MPDDFYRPLHSRLQHRVLPGLQVLHDHTRQPGLLAQKPERRRRELAVRRWVRAARKGGADGLKAKPSPGRHRKLTAHQEQEQEQLPPCAPDLNPVEPLWSWLKWVQFANYAADSAGWIDMNQRQKLRAIHRRSKRLRSFFDTSELSFPEGALPS